MNKKILSIFVMIMALSLFGVSCSNEDSTGTGGNNSGPTGGSGTPTPPTKEEVVKFQGSWWTKEVASKVSGDAGMPPTFGSIFTINADDSIIDGMTKQTISLDKINKVSDNVFEFTSETTVAEGKMTLKHKVDFTDNNAPKDTFVWTREAQGQSGSATYEGTLNYN